MHYYKNNSHFKLPRVLNKVERYIDKATGAATLEATEQMEKTVTERAALSKAVVAQIKTRENLKVDARTEVEVQSGDSLTKIIKRQFEGVYPNARLALLSSAFMDKQGSELGGNVHFLDIGDTIIFSPEEAGKVSIQRKEGSSQAPIAFIDIFPQEADDADSVDDADGEPELPETNTETYLNNKAIQAIQKELGEMDPADKRALQDNLDNLDQWTQKEAIQSELMEIDENDEWVPMEGFKFAEPDSLTNWKIVEERMEAIPAPE